jgi:hypothetical protein
MLNQQQRKFLLDRLEAIRVSKPTTYSSVNVLETPAVKNARKQIESASKVIKEHDKKIDGLRKQRNERIRATVTEIKQAVLFGDAKGVIAMLDDFEKKTF